VGSTPHSGVEPTEIETERSQEQGVTATSSEWVKQRVIFLPGRNQPWSWTVVQIMNVILVALLTWIVVAAILTVVFGGVIRVRNEREIPPRFDQDAVRR